MNNYSQTTEQPVILNYFKDFKGTFIDIGANDGVTFSNTYALYLKAWSGVYVEASPKAFAKLTKNIVKDDLVEFHQLALGKQNGGLILNESGPLVTKEDVALVSTFHQSEMKRFEKVVTYNHVPVECYDWPTFLQKTTFKTFDFISMDIEGSELEVLPQIDLSETKMICIEWNGNHKLMIEYEKYLTGFRLIHTTGENLIYAK
jgi:FkbM family methyltransferase